MKFEIDVKIEFMEAGFFFNEKSGLHPEKPLINVIWIISNKAFGAIETIENIFDPEATMTGQTNIPEVVRLKVLEKYKDKLEPYLVK